MVSVSVAVVDTIGGGKVTAPLTPFEDGKAAETAAPPATSVTVAELVAVQNGELTVGGTL